MKMKTHNYDEARRVNVYRRGARGGNKPLVSQLEASGYENDILIANTIQKKKKKMKKYDEKKAAKVGKIAKELRKRMYFNYCEGLATSLAASNTGQTVGRITYSALVRAWQRDTCGNAYRLNNTAGKRIYDADSSDSRVVRVGVEGHYSYYVSTLQDSDTDSLTVQVAQWLGSWQAWYESVVQYGHYGDCGSCAAGVLTRVGSLWSHRGKGGRASLSDAAKVERKAAKAVDALSADAALQLLARKLGLSESALAALRRDSAAGEAADK